MSLHTTITRLLLLSGMLFINSVSIAFADDRPNAIVILTDDLGYSDLGCYGSKIATPTLDGLAERGVRFTQFYNSSKCEPTRASLMSGQYWQDAGFGVRCGLTMGEAMKLGRYATFAVGKWHLDGNPLDRGFGHYFGHLAGGSHYFKVAASQRLDLEVFKQPPGEDFYMTDANADFAIKFIDDLQQDNPDKPFFLYLAFNSPHSPLHARPEDIAKYRQRYTVGWDKIRDERYQKQLELGIVQPEWKLPPRDASVPAWDSLTEQEQAYESTRMAIYAAMVDRMDQAIGRVLETVKTHGEEDNTLVIFLSDNGSSASDPSTAPKTVAGLLGENGAGKDGYWAGIGWSNASNTPFRRFKCDMTGGGILTSCVASWPAVIKAGGKLTDESSHIIDLMATTTDVGGVDWPDEHQGQKLKPLPGKSLWPLLAGETRKSHDALYFHLFHNRAVISDGIKLVSNWEAPWQLYDLGEDRTELHDLSKQQPELTEQLAKQWEGWYAGVPEKRWSEASGRPRYRRINDPEETFDRRTGNGDEEIIVRQSEVEKSKQPPAKRREIKQPGQTQGTARSQ